MRRYALLLLAAVLSLAFAPAPLPRPPSGAKDAQRLQGTWVLVSRMHGGVESRNGLGKVVIRGDRLFYHCMDGTVASTWFLALDAGKSPTRYDLKEGRALSPTLQGAYELEGDALRLCYVANNVPRPDDFDGRKPGRWLEAYWRLAR